MGIPIITDHVKLLPQSNDSNTEGFMTLPGEYTDPADGSKTVVDVKCFVDPNGNADETELLATLNRFQRESEIWHRTSHPNIIPFFGKCRLNVEGWISQTALVYLSCENGFLHNYVEGHETIDASHLVKGVARGLEYLHGKGVVYGELSPTTVKVRANGDAVLCDFSHAKVVGTHGLTTNTTITTRFAAPETWNSNSPAAFTKAADVFSFGMTAVFVYSKKVPFYDSLQNTDLRRQILANRDLRHEDYSEIPDNIWSILKPCWSYDPQDRPSISEIIELMEAP